MKTPTIIVCTALVLATLASRGAGQPAAPQRALGTPAVDADDVAQPLPPAAAAKAAPWPADHGDVDAQQIAHDLHKLQPNPRGDSPPDALVEHIEAALHNATTLLGPFWINHSHAERTEQLRLNLGERGKRYRAERSAQRRRTQGKWADSSEAAKDASVIERLDGRAGAASCDDPLATNTGAATPCAYDCEQLQQEYFPGDESRCFLFEPSSGTWPEQGGQGDELLSMRKQRLEMQTFVSKEDGTNPPAAGVPFTIGVGRECREVTITSTFMSSGETHTETVCLVDGEHEHNHTITEEHSVEVAGYESGVQEGAGGTTQFVVGECTDVLLRVTTTAEAGPMTWSLDDGGHNGPWTFDISGAVGAEEVESCMFDNDFTLVRQGGAGWQGSVEVVGFIHYRNTIEIPNDESWIVQGTVDATGLPASLDGRLSSGTPVGPSHANIVLRDIRFTGQVASVDAHPEWRMFFFPLPDPRLGGAFQYTGGSDDPANLARLIFERVVFDHNLADFVR
eukprot:COSAG04_NODE_543_length_12846_cov_7.281556_5_plen_509_part_00